MYGFIHSTIGSYVLSVFEMCLWCSWNQVRNPTSGDASRDMTMGIGQGWGILNGFAFHIELK